MRMALARGATLALAFGLFGTAPAASGASSQPHLGLRLRRPGAAPGYTLYAPDQGRETVLVDLDGKVVHRWPSGLSPGSMEYLLPNGDLVRAGDLDRPNRFLHGKGGGGRIERRSWDGKLRWSFDYDTPQHRQHHDIEPLPNGHVLFIAWEHVSRAQAIEAGRDPALLSDGDLWPDTIVEVDPQTRQVVWKWRAFDHLVQDRDPTKPNYGVVADHPEKIDVNFTLGGHGGRDWTHMNSVDYDATHDQILVSVRQFSEIWIIDHSIGTEEARGPAGDLAFRYGNPAASDHGDVGDQELFTQHDAQWIAPGRPGAGSIIVFSNGQKDIREWSTVEQITPALVDGHYQRSSDGLFAATRTRVYGNRGRERFFGFNTSGAQRLANGNTLITDGPHGHLFEVTPRNRVVWDFVNPFFEGDADRRGRSGAGFVTDPWRLFRAERYDPGYPGLRRLG
jgi:hypothetical protein